MNDTIELSEKYERSGWPSLERPDRKPPPGWNLALLTALGRVRNHSLSPDGKRVAFIWDRDDQSDVYWIPAEGGWPRRISFERELTPYWEDETPCWSPDSRWLAFRQKEHVVVADLEAGGLPRQISDFAASASTPKWMPDSQGLVVSIERYGADQLLLTDREGAWPRALTAHPDGDAWDPQPAPDGQRLAYVYRPFKDLNRLDIHLINISDGVTSKIFSRPGVFSHTPRWSPNGRILAFLSQVTGFYELWLAYLATGKVHQLTHCGCSLGSITWSPDGSRLACTANRSGRYELAMIDVSTGNIETLRAGHGCHTRPNWSPSGDFLTIEYETPSQFPELYRIDLPSGKETRLTQVTPPALEQQSLLMPETVSYTSSDDVNVPALLFRPKHPNGAGILYPHGGPSVQHIYEWDGFVQYMLAKGYTCLAVNYRGSVGYGRDYERLNYNQWGQGDVQDCLVGARYLSQIEGIDPARLAIYGSSYGGYLAICCLARDPEYRFACGVSRYGDANLTSTWAQSNRHLRLYSQMFLDHPERNRQVYLDGSPIHQVQDIRSPLLLMHGLLDDVVPPQASEELVEALRSAGKTFEYKTYANEGHGFLHPANQLDAYTRTERFLDWYLLPRGNT